MSIKLWAIEMKRENNSWNVKTILKPTQTLKIHSDIFHDNDKIIELLSLTVSQSSLANLRLQFDLSEKNGFAWPRQLLIKKTDHRYLYDRTGLINTRLFSISADDHGGQLHRQ